MLSLPTISFEINAKVAEQLDLEMCSYGQSLEVQMLRDLDTDLGSGQGHIHIHSSLMLNDVYCLQSCTVCASQA